MCRGGLQALQLFTIVHFRGVHTFQLFTHTYFIGVHTFQLVHYCLFQSRDRGSSLLGTQLLQLPGSVGSHYPSLLGPQLLTQRERMRPRGEGQCSVGWMCRLGWLIMRCHRDAVGTRRRAPTTGVLICCINVAAERICEGSSCVRGLEGERNDSGAQSAGRERSGPRKGPTPYPKRSLRDKLRVGGHAQNNMMAKKEAVLMGTACVVMGVGMRYLTRL